MIEHFIELLNTYEQNNFDEDIVNHNYFEEHTEDTESQACAREIKQPTD